MARAGELKSLIKDLNSVSNNRQDRSLFGYRAKQYYLQTLGYMLVDQRRSLYEGAAFPETIPIISEQEKKLLRSFQKQFEDFNKECISKLLAISPDIWLAVSPFNKFDYDMTGETDPEILFTANSLNNLIGEFKKHPAIELALGLWAELGLAASVENLRRAVIQFENVILHSGEKVPAEVEKLIYISPRDSRVRKVFRFLVCLMSIRCSLHMVNQLVFQVLTQDKKWVFDRDNIIELQGPLRYLCGDTYKIVTLLNGDTFLVNPNDLVLLVARENRSLIWIQNSTFQISEEFGDTLSSFSRGLDQHLNLFGPLLSQK